MRSLGCCDYTFGIIVLTIITLASLGIHNASNITKEPCHIASASVNFICYHQDNNGGSRYLKYYTYKVHIISSNLTTLGSYDCGFKDGCNICPGNTSLTIGALRECYTFPLMYPEYNINNGAIVTPINAIYVISIIGLIGSLIAIVAWMVMYVMDYQSRYLTIS